MAALWREFIDEPTLTLLGDARKALDDDEWRAIICDGASCGDPDLAAQCVKLAASISRLAMGQAKHGTDERPSIADTAALVQSRLRYAHVAGARCACHIAKLLPAEGRALLNLYQQGTTGTRSVLLSVATRRGDDEPSTQMLVLGLSDRAKGVRQAAAYACTRCTSPKLAEALEERATTEPDAELRALLAQQLSLVTKGYWLGEVEYGHREIIVNIEGYHPSTSVPQAAIETYGERECAGYYQRMLRGVSSPTYDEDSRWVGDRHAEWLLTDEFRAFQQSVPSASLEDASDPAKRAALQAKLKAQPTPFITADDFLDGNEDEFSIGPNLDPHPGLKAFRKVLGDLTKHPDTRGIFFEIDEVPDIGWPYAQWLYICTTAPVPTIEKALRRLKPDTVSAATGEVPHPAPEGAQWLAAWWD